MARVKRGKTKTAPVKKPEPIPVQVQDPSLQKLKDETLKLERGLQLLNDRFKKKSDELAILLKDKDKEQRIVNGKIRQAESDLSRRIKEAEADITLKKSALGVRERSLSTREKLLSEKSNQLETERRRILDMKAKTDNEAQKNAADKADLAQQRKDVQALAARNREMLKENDELLKRIQEERKAVEKAREDNQAILDKIQKESEWLKKQTAEAQAEQKKLSISRAEREAFDASKEDYDKKHKNFANLVDKNKDKTNELRTWEIALRNNERDLVRRERILHAAEKKIAENS